MLPIVSSARRRSSGLPKINGDIDREGEYFDGPGIAPLTATVGWSSLLSLSRFLFFSPFPNGEFGLLQPRGKPKCLVLGICQSPFLVPCRINSSLRSFVPVFFYRKLDGQFCPLKMTCRQSRPRSAKQSTNRLFFTHHIALSHFVH